MQRLLRQPFCFLQVLFMGLFGGFASFCAQNYCHAEQIICKTRGNLQFNRILTLGWWYLCGKATGRRRRMVISVGAQSAAVRMRYFAPAPTNEKSRRIQCKIRPIHPPHPNPQSPMAPQKNCPFNFKLFSCALIRHTQCCIFTAMICKSPKYPRNMP